jgi:hypothetical protein
MRGLEEVAPVKSVFVSVALLCLPLAALPQPVQFNIQCLPPAQQDEIKARAQVIQDAAAARRASVTQQVGGRRVADLRADKEAKETALSECTYNARKAGKWPGDVCVEQISVFAAASRAYTAADGTLDRALQPVVLEERNRLLELRAQYPDCPVTLLPDNPVIRK